MEQFKFWIDDMAADDLPTLLAPGFYLQLDHFLDVPYGALNYSQTIH
jgi:hypothetical protein